MKTFWLALFSLVVGNLITIHPADSTAAQAPGIYTPAEMATKERWVREQLLSNQVPFRFSYGGQPSTVSLQSWAKTVISTELDQQRTERVISWRDDQTGLQIRCRAIEYHDFPTVEWTVYFKNVGSEPTPVLADIQAIEITLNKRSGNFVLHHLAGDNCSAHSYEPFQSDLQPKTSRSFAPDGGRPTNGKYPFFNVAFDGGGLIAVLGWPGQWSATFVRDVADGLTITGGQEKTHLKLRPGEEIRTPLVVLQFWEGDWIRSQNIWRRWMIAHNLPRPTGKLPQPFTSVCLGLNQSEKTEKEGIDLFEKHHAKLDFWWMDAGWYPTDQGWVKVGTWEPDPPRFPNGIKAVSDYAHAKGLKLVLWFEPERVVKGTWLFAKHPDWLLGQKDWRLLNLGNADARQWLTDYIDTFLTREGIDLYRQDFNFDPLPFWRAEDAPERQGMTENQHVQGYLAFWDELRRRHPDMLIDSCASGGRRNDLETLRRAVPLLRSDYQQPQNPKDANIVVGNQGHTYGLSFWVPYYGTGQFANDKYDFRSHLCPAMGIGFAPGEPDWDAWHRAHQDWELAAPNFYGDYYPLTEYSLAENSWMAWQFDRPESGCGMVQAFRRTQCKTAEVRLKLRGLESKLMYEITDRDKTGRRQISGRELTEFGLTVRLELRQAALILYRRVTAE